MNQFWLCFVPLFVAVDAIGVLPIFMSLTEGVSEARVRKVVIQSVITAGIVASLFVVIGIPLLALLGITVADFMVAGGVLLFLIALTDMLSAEKAHRKVDPATIGAVPIGVPLITGPAVLTTCILLMNQYGTVPTFSAVILNIAIAGLVFWFAAPIGRYLGSAGTRTISKIASLLLASIAVMVIRKGIVLLISQG